MENLSISERLKLSGQYDRMYEIEFEKILDARIAEFDENTTFKRMITLNGIPKREFLKSLKPLVNSSDVEKYEKNGLSESLTEIFEKLEDREIEPHTKSELLITIRKLLYYETTSQETIDWFSEQRDEVNIGLFVCLYDGNNKCLQREVCFTVASLAYKLGADFQFYAEETINSFLVMLCSWLDSFDNHLTYLRKKRVRHSDRKLLTGKTEPLVYPKFALPKSGGSHMEVSSCLYAISFIIFYCNSPEVIMLILQETTVRKEMSRYYLIQILHTTILGLTRNKIKESRLWKSLPKQFYFEVSRLYADSNMAVRKLVREMMDHLHNISIVKLPIMEGRLVEQLENFQIEKKKNSKNSSDSSISSQVVHRGRRKTEILPNLAHILPMLSGMKTGNDSEASTEETLVVFSE